MSKDYQKWLQERAAAIEAENYIDWNPKPKIPVSHVYFVQSGEAIKIGKAVSPVYRMTCLQVGNPVKLKMLGYFQGNEATERALHIRFRPYWIHGEWFRDNSELRAVIAKCPANDNAIAPAAKTA